MSCQIPAVSFDVLWYFNNITQPLEILNGLLLRHLVCLASKAQCGEIALCSISCSINILYIVVVKYIDGKRILKNIIMAKFLRRHHHRRQMPMPHHDFHSREKNKNNDKWTERADDVERVKKNNQTVFFLNNIGQGSQIYKYIYIYIYIYYAEDFRTEHISNCTSPSSKLNMLCTCVRVWCVYVRVYVCILV
jgi:hypothetical protein